MSGGSGIATAAAASSAALTDFRTRMVNSLDDSTLKYSNAILDEALRKALNEYTRAFPNVQNAQITVSTAGKSQSLNACSNLMNIIKLVHPYNAGSFDPFFSERFFYSVNWIDGVPQLYLKGSPIPKVGDVIFVQYAGRQTINALDSASITTIRSDHEGLLVVGAAGQAAMMRASGLTEKWGTIPNQQSNLMLWGSNQYQRFIDFLIEIRAEVPLDIFPKSAWRLDEWDQGI